MIRAKTLADSVEGGTAILHASYVEQTEHLRATQGSKYRPHALLSVGKIRGTKTDKKIPSETHTSMYIGGNEVMRNTQIMFSWGISQQAGRVGLNSLALQKPPIRRCPRFDDANNHISNLYIRTSLLCSTTSLGTDRPLTQWGQHNPKTIAAATLLLSGGW